MTTTDPSTTIKLNPEQIRPKFLGCNMSADIVSRLEFEIAKREAEGKTRMSRSALIRKAILNQFPAPPRTSIAS